MGIVGSQEYYYPVPWRVLNLYYYTIISIMILEAYITTSSLSTMPVKDDKNV